MATMPSGGVPSAGGNGAVPAAAEMPGETVGILAGGGGLPLILADAVRAAGRTVHIVAIEGHADRGIEAFPHHWVNLGRIGGMLASFRRAGCREIVIAGAIERPNLRRLRIDAGFVRQLPTLLAMTRGGDDSVLRRVVGFFESQGFRVRGAGELAPSLEAPLGPLGHHRPEGAALAAIARAEHVIRALGAFDLGQGVVATADRVVAVEGVRGTDAMLADLGPGGCGAGLGRGAVLVKLAKPGQEMRIDLPAIGPVTIERAVAAGLAGVAVGAGNALVLDRHDVTRLADDAGVFVTGIASGGARAAAPSPRAFMPATPLTLLSRHAPTPSDRRDLAVARRLLPILSAEAAGPAAVISGEHVLAVSGALPVEKLIGPLAARSRWGLWALRGRTGTLALDLAPGLAGGGVAPTSAALLGIELFRAAKEARLAGLACFGAPIPEAVKADVVAWANEARIFLMVEMP